MATLGRTLQTKHDEKCYWYMPFRIQDGPETSKSATGIYSFDYKATKIRLKVLLVYTVLIEKLSKIDNKY